MSRTIAVTIEIRGDDGISDRQAIGEVNEALAADGRHPLAVRRATTYEVRLGVSLFQVFGGNPHDRLHGAAKPPTEWMPPEDNSRRAAGRKPRRKP